MIRKQRSSQRWIFRHYSVEENPTFIQCRKPEVAMFGPQPRGKVLSFFQKERPKGQSGIATLRIIRIQLGMILFKPFSKIHWVDCGLEQTGKGFGPLIRFLKVFQSELQFPGMKIRLKPELRSLELRKTRIRICGLQQPMDFIFMIARPMNFLIMES